MSATPTPTRTLQDDVRAAFRDVGKTEDQIRADMAALAPVLYSVEQIARRRTVKALRSVAAELADEARDHQQIRARVRTLAAHEINERADAIQRKEVRS